MQRICDICGRREGTLFDRVTENGIAVEYAYCEACYSRALKSGIAPSDEAKRSISKRGKVCYTCGCTEEQFGESFLFGCPDCYRNMREVASRAIVRAQGAKGYYFDTPDEFDGILSRADTPTNKFRCADECSVNDLVRDNVVSSRIRLARNANGIIFPHRMQDGDRRTGVLILAAARAANGMFDALISRMSELANIRKKVLIERHLISLPLANNKNGALLIERGERSQISVMINEEDHFREQCVTDGHSLQKAYKRLHEYDIRLHGEIPLACDERLGYLTACPSNVGTGLRASEMLFLPALRRTGAIDDVFQRVVRDNGLTVRGYFGEGSEGAYDMYQISNSRTFGVDDLTILWQVEQAAIRLCYYERVALEKLFSEQNTSLIDGIFRSYGVLTSAFSLTAKELMELLVDVKIGVILGILPVKSTALINSIIERCSSLIEITGEGASADEYNKARARIVRQTLAEAK